MDEISDSISDPYIKIRNKDERIIYVYDNNGKEEELIVSLNETVLDLKHKIEDKYHLKRNILINQNIRKKNIKQRTQSDLNANNTTLAENHIHNETGIYFSVLENKGGIKNS